MAGTTRMAGHKARATEKEYFNRKLSDTDFELMDIESEGSVGYDEFLVFMLVAMGKVSPEDIQNMEELYQRLAERPKVVFEYPQVVVLGMIMGEHGDCRRH